MKSKTINIVLRKKFNEWVSSISDPNVRKLVSKNTIITGGCITSMLLKEKVNDYDLYFTDEATCVKVAMYYINEYKRLHPDCPEITLVNEEGRVKIKVNSRDLRPTSEEGFTFSDDPGDEEVDTTMTHVEDTSDTTLPKYRPVYMSANAITLSDKMQLVIRFYGPAATIHENYDFDHCKCYWTSDVGSLFLPAKALEAMLARELVYTGSKYPLASIIRTRKFITRGWQINAGQYLKMCLQLNAFDLTNLATLEDQLIGMDAVYFANLLASIPANQVVDGKIDTSYIMGIINRFF